MKGWTLLALVLLVGALVWLRLQRDEERADAGTVPFQRPLLPGLVPTDVGRIRVEHLERGTELLLERDGYGRWYLSEPLAYPAEGALVKALLGYLAGATGPVVPDPDLEALALAPPRVVVELAAKGEDGPERSWRLEVGALDLDSRLVYARVPGHPDAPAGAEALVTRVIRSIDTTLDRSPDDFREGRIATIPFGQVTEVRRGGSEDPGLYFEAFQDGSVWRRADEPRVSLDASALGIWLRAATSVPVLRFADDAPTDVSAYGLDDPRIEVELVAADGRRELLLFSTASKERELPFARARWYALRDGFPHVWEVRPNDVVPLTADTVDLYDYALVRAAEDDVQRIELTTAGAEGKDAGLVLERREDGWWVEELGVVQPRRRRADGDRVGSVVATLSQAELGEYAPPGAFFAGDAPHGLVVRTGSGAGVDARIGTVWRDMATGAEGPLLRRRGEGVAATVPPEVMALFDLTLSDLEDRVVHAVDEGEVDRIELRHGDATRVYRRDERRWSLDGGGAVDGSRAVLLERLLRLEAEAWLDGPAQALTHPLHVTFAGRRSLAFTLGRLPDGRLAVETPERRAVLPEDPLQEDLHAALLATFR